MNDLKTEQVRI